ncbi:MAG TPA: acylphosphatase [Dissulfurispiraceae bacterium]|nr:acylphosphatase [Dissulfurispiraceae bacterium]
MKARAHLIIEGKVKGVGFRIFMSEVALSCGLTGWVMNLPNGNIEAVFEGERKSVEIAICKCSQGTTSARISKVEVDWREKPETLTTFMIRY